jgi:hypothetical protein
MGYRCEPHSFLLTESHAFLMIPNHFGPSVKSKKLARIFHESLATTTDMDVLPGVLGRQPLRRTVLVRLGTNTLRLPGGTPILFALAALRSVPQAGSQFRGLATEIHEISGLEKSS